MWAGKAGWRWGGGGGEGVLECGLVELGGRVLGCGLVELGE